MLLPPSLQAVAKASTGPDSWSRFTIAHAVSVAPRADPAARAHHGQRHEWAERHLALSAQPASGAWRAWPEPLRTLVEQIRATSPFTPTCLAAVAAQCAADEDLEANLRWMREGVPLADAAAYPPPFHPANSPSADPSTPSGAGLQVTVQKEIAAGRVLPLPRGLPARWVHPLAAVMKDNGKIREIHNHKRRLNDYMSYARTSISTLDTICSGFQRGMQLAVLDISCYYRHWQVRPQDWALQVFQMDVFGHGQGLWFDPCMEFGARNSPEIANRAAAMFCRSFRRWLRARGHGIRAFVCVNTDDWLLGAHPPAALLLYHELQRFLRAMGLTVNDAKGRPPALQQQYCGWVVDAARMCVRLTPSKLEKALRTVQDCLRATRAIELQAWERLYGFLQHVCTVVPWGSMWMQGIGACKLAAGRAAAGSFHCSEAAREELLWWESNMTAFDGRRRYLGPARPVPDHGLSLYTDATGVGGTGIFAHGTALWAPPSTVQRYFEQTFDTADAAARGDAQIWELAAVVVLVEVLGDALAQRGVRALTWHTDSSSAAAAMNRLSHRNSSCLLLLRRLYATLHGLDIVILAEHVPGVDNVLADALSRWHEPGKQDAFHVAAAAWSERHNTSVRVQEWRP